MYCEIFECDKNFVRGVSSAMSSMYSFIALAVLLLSLDLRGRSPERIRRAFGNLFRIAPVTSLSFWHTSSMLLSFISLVAQ